MLEQRFEKLRYLIQEMRLVLYLATYAPDSFTSRTLARHILVRAENFIAHARALRKPLNLAGFNTQSYHQTKEAYADAFEEYFQVARDRIGAHMQDLDFGRRIELWNEIESVKSAYFVEGAIQLYNTLASMGIQGCIPLEEPTELTDEALREILIGFQRSMTNQSRVEFGVDPLAMTRENTVATINLTSVHVRAGQLALIRRWIGMQRDLLAKLGHYPNIVRILKERIATDIVSYCDCLITRQVPPGALQEMDGLDVLVRAGGQSDVPISEFKSACKFDQLLEENRAIRNKVGSHLEADETISLAIILSMLDAYDIDRSLAFFDLSNSAFTKICANILYLRLYAADGHRVFQVTANPSKSVPYSGTSSELPPVPPAAPIFDETNYQKNLIKWLDGDAEQKEDARQYFYNAFMSSEQTETIDEIDTLFGGSMSTRNPFRTAHIFLARTLSMDISDQDFGGTIDLAVRCRGGWPYPLAEALIRNKNPTTNARRWMICYALGEIGSHPHATADTFLWQCTKSEIWTLALQAKLALFKIFIKSEGIYRLNHQGKVRIDYDRQVAVLTAGLSEQQRFLHDVAFASVLSGASIGSLGLPFSENYSSLQKQLQVKASSYCQTGDTDSAQELLGQLIKTNDFVGVCIYLATNSSISADSIFSEMMLDACCGQLILAAPHDQAARHLAMCYYHRKDYVTAFSIVETIAARNPAWLDIQILAAQILTEMPGSEDKTLKRISQIRDFYNLGPSAEADLANCEEQIAHRLSQQLGN